MARPYCILADVQRLLRTAAKKVKTSEAYRDLGYDTSNDGTVRLLAVSLLDSYLGVERFEVTFSDSTNFEVTGEDIGFLGSGDMFSEFECSYFTISPSQWQGVPTDGDIVYFVSNSNISVDDAELFILDQSVYINNYIGKTFGDTTNLEWEQDLNADQPEILKYACTYRTAYYIFISVYAGVEIDGNPVAQWKSTAESAIKLYISNRDNEKIQGLPRWKSRHALANTLGIDGSPLEAEYVSDLTEEDRSYNR